jgi:hypothetical protein
LRSSLLCLEKISDQRLRHARFSLPRMGYWYGVGTPDEMRRLKRSSLSFDGVLVSAIGDGSSVHRFALTELLVLRD